MAESCLKRSAPNLSRQPQGDEVKIAIFAARSTQRHYANKLSEYLRHMGATETQVFWYKLLWRTPYWIPTLLTKPKGSFLEVVKDFLKVKRNTPAGLIAGGKRFYALFPLKLLEAKILYSVYRNALHKQSITHMVIWNGLKFRQRIAVMAARDLGIPCYFIERGVFPGTTTMDPQGINFLNTIPRDPLFYMQQTSDTDPCPKLKCQELRPSQLPEHYIFVPFQVNTDSQVVMFSPWISDMFDLVKKFQQAHQTLGLQMPSIVFKPHPACEQDYSELAQSLNKDDSPLKIISDIPTPVLIQHAEAVCTINSSVGMESLLMGKKLIVLGNAFYDIQGIALSAANQETLCQKLLEFSNWTPNNILRQRFLQHLKAHHIVPGSWHDPDGQHMDSMSNRILHYIGAAN